VPLAQRLLMMTMKELAVGSVPVNVAENAVYTQGL